MPTPLPKKIDPRKLAVANARLHGEIPLRSMARLVSLLRSSEGQVAVTLEGSIDEKQNYVVGHLEAEVQMSCQRCMESTALPLALDVRWALVNSEAQMVTLPDDCEPLLAPEGTVLLSDLVEDELILALPLIPVHADVGQCRANGYMLNKTSISPAEKSNPFAVLSTLLKDSNIRSD